MAEHDIEALKAAAEKATPGPWASEEGSTGYPECDDRDYWNAVLSPGGKDIVTLYERYTAKEDDRVDYDFDAAFIALANPAAILELIAERDALRRAATQALWHIGTDADRIAMPQAVKWRTSRDEAADMLRAALSPLEASVSVALKGE